MSAEGENQVDNFRFQHLEMEVIENTGGDITQMNEDANVLDRNERSEVVQAEIRSHDLGEVSDIDDDGEGQEDVEDVWHGEDPSELEVEKFCLPSENTILEDLNIYLKKRKLFVYPMKLMDLAHPIMIDCLDKCSDFKTTYLQNNNLSSGNSWSGLIELTFKTPFYAMEALDSLKSIRDDIIIKQHEVDETATRKMQDKWISDNATVSSAVPRNVKNMLVLRRLTENVQSSQLRHFFPSSLNIVISKESLKSQSSDWNLGKMAYVFFNSKEDLDAAVEKYSQTSIEIDGVQLKLIPYQPPNFPYGLIKMKRRYRLLCQIRELKKIMKEQEILLNETSKYRIRMNIEQCKLTLEKDNKARKELGLPLHSLSYLHRIPAIRESIPPDFDWMPQISFRTEDDDDRFYGRRDNKKRSKRGRRGSNSWMDNTPRRKDPPPRSGGAYNQIARVHEIAAKIAQISSNIGTKSQSDQDQSNRSRAPIRRSKEFENSKRQRSPENPSVGDATKKLAKPEEAFSNVNQSRDNIKPLMSVQDTGMSWGERNEQKYENYNNQRGANTNQPNQGYNMMNTNQAYGNSNYNQGSYDHLSVRPQGSQGNNCFNYSQNYDARYSYPGYGYPQNMWGLNQNMTWNSQQNNYQWPNQS